MPAATDCSSESPKVPGKMESAKGKEATASIFAEILPPLLEDAGLEDCALPPESIKEAFMKAAFAVKSRASSLLSPSTEDSVEDDLVSGPIPEGFSDSVLGAEVEWADLPCVVEKKGGGEPRGDLSAPEVEAGSADDRVMVPGVEGEGKETCAGDRPRGEAGVHTRADAATEEEGDGDEAMLVEGVVRSSA